MYVLILNNRVVDTLDETILLPLKPLYDSNDKPIFPKPDNSIQARSPFHPDMKLIDVGENKISVGQTYDGKKFGTNPAHISTVEDRLQNIKDECRRRIYGVATAETQMNMNLAIALILAKGASATVDDQGMVAAASKAAIWVREMRAAIAVIANDETLVVDDDATWPECPDDVIALAGSF